MFERFDETGKRQITLKSDKISEPFRIALVTDLHSCSYGKDEAALVKMVVSRGLSRERMPVPRLFNHPELVIIDVE